jgi:hypothetical protein
LFGGAKDMTGELTRLVGKATELVPTFELGFKGTEDIFNAVFPKIS